MTFVPARATTAALAARFAHDTRGNVAMIFGLTLLPAMLMVGSAVDYGRGLSEKSRLQSAIDATALALAKEPKGTPVATLQAKATATFNAVFQSEQGGALPAVTVSTSATAISLTVRKTVPTAFMQLAGYSTMTLNASTQVAYGRSKIEVALVLDNTGSMAQAGKMPALKSAASTFLNQLAATSPTVGDVKVSVVPFATQVNVGASNVAQPWLDTSAVIPAAWTGCVADRDQSYDVNANAGAPYPARNCTPSNLSQMKPLTDISVAAGMNGLQALIGGMQPSGNTNLTIGMAWGLNTLTAGSPAPGAAAFGSPDVEKFLVLLTDGDNTQNRWTTNAPSIDDRTRMACNEAKAPGKKITVFTVRVIQGNATLLRDCATSPSQYYEAADASQIAPAFQKILDAITRIRLTH